MPELSYGSHFFQDLVEAGILYSAVFKDETTLAFDADRLTAMGEEESALPVPEELRGIVHFINVENSGVMLYYDMISEHLLITDRRGQ